MSSVFFKNKDDLETKISKLRKDGFNKLHIVSDFDRTLTKCFIGGKKVSSMMALLREGDYLGKDYIKKAHELFSKYHPIELDESLSHEQRAKKMQQWWQSHQKLIIENRLHKSVIDEIIAKNHRMLREGAKIFFDFLKKYNIPLLIFSSSGFGNLIYKYLENENVLSQNVHILTNVFEFDAEGYATSYKGPIIHVMNKSETKINNPSYRKLIKERQNIILLGDSISDLGMAADMDSNTIIKIGFLNEDIETKLDLYLQNYDIVITEDGPMDYINKLLNKIVT